VRKRGCSQCSAYWMCLRSLLENTTRGNSVLHPPCHRGVLDPCEFEREVGACSQQRRITIREAVSTPSEREAQFCSRTEMCECEVKRNHDLENHVGLHVDNLYF
jgi:hypothetical protein